MQRLLATFLLIFTSLLHAEAPTVIVSVAPHKFFVEKIAGNTLQVYLMVPAGASAHTFEPSPRQMMQASLADIWFTIGETFETRAIQALQSHKPTLKLINLQQGLNLISDEQSRCHCCSGSYDLHFWLSARQAQIQARTITAALSELYPDQASLYRKNLEAFQTELQALDLEIETILVPLKNRYIVVGHPAYAYFCRDYHLKQYSIEVEGKDPTPQQMTKLLNLVQTLKVKKIFVQPQYNNKAAELVAKEIDAHLKVLDPYSENYLASMREIAHAFAEQ